MSQQIGLLNAKLPSNVYVPFLEDRQNVILNMPVKEVRLFQTKERCPLLIQFEVFEPSLELKFAERSLTFDKHRTWS